MPYRRILRIRLDKSDNVKPLPTKSEISPSGGTSLDEASALRDFYGKTVEEIEILMQKNPLRYFEGFMWMGPYAFLYYIHAGFNYLKSPASFLNGDSVDAFEKSTRFQIRNNPLILREEHIILAICEYLLENANKFFECEDEKEKIKDRLSYLKEQVK
jgi:hypothetical protein